MNQSHDASIGQRLSFLGIDDEVRATLRSIWPQIQKALPTILDAFYQRAGTYGELRDRIRSQESRLKSAQSSHWQQLFSGQFDYQYYESVKRIGLAHVKIGLEPRWYIGGYAFIQDQLLDLIGRMHRFNGPKAARVGRHVMKAIMLDMELAISVYNEKLMGDLNAKNECVSAAVREFDDVMRAALNEVGVAAKTLDQTADVL
ncbi:MAG: hypothetical protein JNM13_06030 [Hyphomicrobiaceae bacterium]|nr:hypothetical protein [Hyphomicrobiaceae bacterium]